MCERAGKGHIKAERNWQFGYILFDLLNNNCIIETQTSTRGKKEETHKKHTNKKISNMGLIKMPRINPN